MTKRPILRAHDVRDRITLIRELIDGLSLSELQADSFKMAALERFLEVISEASRHIPADWKCEFGPDIPWRRVADIGNVIRHVYEHVDPGVLWDICQHDLAALERAVLAMIARHEEQSHQP